MRKIFAALVLTLSAPAFAVCTGYGAFQTCTDGTGNSYNVNRIGNTTITNGYNTQNGTTWNQTSQNIGNMTIHNGRAANGQSWNMTTQRFGNGNSSTYGRDSQGNSVYCTTFNGQTICN